MPAGVLIMRAHHSGSRIVSTIRYRDAAAAIDWLCDAFGFDRHLIVPALDGTVAHAQLVHGSGMVMIGTARDDEYGALVRPPDQSYDCLLYTSPSPRDRQKSRMPSSA